MSDLVSIVIPVYNCGKYLSECLESVVNQTYQKIEIILVNSSTDDSGAICDAFAAKDSRITVINKVQEGIFLSRIAGINQAKGAWILYLDGDDKFPQEMVEKLLCAAQEHDADIAICDFYWWAPPNQLKKSIYDYKGVYDKDGIRDEIAPNIMPVDTKKPIHPALWTKLFKTELLRSNFKYYDTKVSIGEDMLLSYPNMLFANKIVFLNEALPYYRQSAIQITVRYKENFLNDLVNRYRIFEILNHDYQGYDFSKQLAKWYVNDSIAVIRNEKKFGKEKRMELIRSLLEHPITREVCSSLQPNDFWGWQNRKLFSALKEENEKKIYKLAFPSKLSYPYRKFKGLLGRIRRVFVKK